MVRDLSAMETLEGAGRWRAASASDRSSCLSTRRFARWQMAGLLLRQFQQRGIDRDGLQLNHPAFRRRRSAEDFSAKRRSIRRHLFTAAMDAGWASHALQHY